MNISADKDISTIEEIRQVILAMDKTSRAQRLYLPNNQILIKHKEELVTRFKRLLSEHGPISLSITPTSMMFEDEIVYENQDRKESFAFRMYNDGIRSITFLEDLDEHELLEFTSLLGKEPEDDSSLEGDIVTALWEKDFQNIRYTVADNILDEPPEPGEKSVDEKIDEMLALDIEETHPDAKTGAAQPSNDEILQLVKASMHFGQMLQKKTVLTEDELARIKKDIEFSERPDKLINDLVDILFDVLQMEKDISDFTMVCEVLTEITSDMVNNGIMYLAADILTRLKNLMHTPMELPHSETSAIIQRTVDALSTKEKVENYVQIVNQGYKNSVDDLYRFITALSPRALKPFLDNLPMVVETTQRRAICKALAELHTGDVSIFVPYLKSKDPQILSDILHLLGFKQDDKTCRIIAPLIRHPDRSVRREVISSMRNFEEGLSTQTLFTALEDPFSDNRTLALRVLAGRKDPAVMQRIASFIRDGSFLERDIQEKKSAFYALAKSGGDAAIPIIRDSLRKRTWFKKDALDEVYQCAIYALASVGTEASLKALYEEGESKNKTVQKYAIQAIRKITQRQRAEALEAMKRRKNTDA